MIERCVYDRLGNMARMLMSPLVRIAEDVCFASAKEILSSNLAPVFIVGAPRTGSTILYQGLTNAFDIKYVDNLACRWYRNFRFGMWLSHCIFGNAPHGNFKAEYGNTSKYGGHAPSECGQFWYRWLPTDHHFVDHDEITPQMVSEIRAEVLGASAYLKRPLLFKNLNAGQRLRLIIKTFPDAKIIFMRRDPRFVTRSIIKARKKAGTREGQWWSIMPPNVVDLLTLPEEQMCAAQVYYLERQIEEDLALFPKANVREIHFQNLSETLLQDLAGWIGVDCEPNGEIPEFQHDDLQVLNPKEQKKLATLVEKYPFNKELFI